MAAERYKVKGSTIKSKFDFVRERFGPAALDKMEQRFRDRNLLPVMHSAWYDYDLFVDVLEDIASVHFGGDRQSLVEVGAHSATVSLGTVYKAFVREGDFVAFLEGMSGLHHMFYNQGRIIVRINDDGRSCEVLHRDKPRYAEADLYVASGFYQKAAELHGLDGIHCGFSVEADGAHFDLSWSG